MASRINYTVGFNADTTQLKTSLQEVQRLLADVGSGTSGFGLSDDMKLAAQSARELSSYLTTAMNVNTGKLDLSKFQQSLKAGGTDLATYADRLQAIGPTGEKAFLAVATAINNAEVPLKRSSATMDKLWMTMKNTMRWQLTSSMLNSFVGSLETAYGYAQDLDESLNNIRIVTSQSTEQMAEFAKQANAAAKALSSTTTDYTNASLIYYQQGLSDKEVEERTDTTIKMANVTGQTAETVSDQMTAIWNNYDDGTRSLESYADAMVALGAATASSSDEIAEGVQQFAAISSTVGLSYDYAVSALATLTAETRQSASVVGTSLRTIFARLQGLSQDETQDDGTDLNKYSRALANIGVDIKEASGDLKDMDDILDETAAKWGDLTQAQQVALANTVAGVRQYTSFIALMDNWGTFQENLLTAQNSEGALQEQQDIYAESWEAARDRVTAAAEDIYDSIFDADTFIAVDNALADTLDIVADVVDGMGGLSGVVETAGALILSVFGDRLAEGLRNTAYNIGLITGVQDEMNLNLKKQAAELAVMTAADSANSTDSEIIRFEYQKRNMQLQTELYAKAQDLTSEQYKQLEAERQSIANVTEMIAKYAELVEEAKQAALDSQDSILIDSTAFKNRDSGQVEYAQIASKITGGVVKQINKEFRSIFNDVDISGFDKLITLFGALKGKTGDLKSLKSQLDLLSQSAKDAAFNTDDLVAEYNRLSSIYKELTGNSFKPVTTATSMKDFEANIASAETGLQRIQTSVYNTTKAVENSILGTQQQPSTFVDSGKLAQATQQLKEYGTAAEDAAYKTRNLEAAQENGSRQMDEFANKINTVQKATQDWAGRIVTIGQSLMSLSIIINSITTLSDVWTDDDLSTGEKLIQTVSSLSMVLISVAPLLTTATKLIDVDSAKKIENLLATEANAAGQIGLGTAAKVGAIGVSSMTKAIGLLSLKLLPIIAIIGGIVAVVKLFNDYTDRTTTTVEEATQAAEDLATAYEDAQDAYEDLVSAMEEYQSARDGLDSLTEGTQEFSEALTEANRLALDLIAKYNLLEGTDWSWDNGKLVIEDDALDDVVSSQLEATNKAYAASLMGDLFKEQTINKDSFSDLVKQLSSDGLNNYGRLASYNVDYETALNRTLQALSENSDLFSGDEAHMAEILAGYNDSSYHMSDNVAHLIWANQEAIKTLAEDYSNTDANAKLYAQEIATELLSGNSSVSESGNAQGIIAAGGSVYQAVYEDLQTGFLETLKDTNFQGKASAEAQDLWKQYIANSELSELDNLSYDFLRDGRLKYTYTDENNDTQTEYVEMETAAAALAASAAINQLNIAADQLVSTFNRLDASGQEYDQAVKSFLTDQNFEDATISEVLSILSNVGTTDEEASAFLAQRLGVSDLTDEVAANYGFETAQAMIEAFVTGLNNIDTAWSSITLPDGLYGADQLTLTTAKTLEATLQQINWGPLGEEGGTLFIEGLNRILAGMDEEDGYQALASLINIDWTSWDAGSEAVKVITDLGYEIDVTDDEWQSFVANMREATNAVPDFETLKDNLTTIYGLTSDLELGDILSEEDYQTLVAYNAELEKYFMLTTTGYQLIADPDIINEGILESATEQVALLQERVALSEKLASLNESGIFDTWSEDPERFQKTVASGLLNSDYLTFLAELGYSQQEIADASTEQIEAILADIQSLSDASTELSDYFELLASTVESTQELDELARETGMDASAYAKAYALLSETESLDDLDADEVKQYSKYLQSTVDGLEDYDDAADAAAKTIMRVNEGIEDLSDNFEEWQEILKSSSNTSQEYYNAMEGLKKAVSDLTTTSSYYITNDFIVEHLDDIALAATGDVDAINRLRSALSDDIVARIILDNNLDSELAAEVNELWSNVQATIPDLEFGASVSDGEFIDALNEMITAAGMTQGQVESLLGSMGFQAQFAKEPQKITQYRTVTRIDENVFTNSTSGARTIIQTMKTHQFPIEDYVDAFAMSTAPEGESLSTPVIDSVTNVNDSSGSSYNTYTPSSGGGGGSSEASTEDTEALKSWDDVVDRYHEINRELDDQESILEDISDQIDRAYGTKKLGLYEQQIKELNKEQEMYNQKLQEAQYWLSQDQEALKQEFEGFTFAFDENGEIQGYEALEQWMMDQYNAVVEAYNAFIENYNSLSADEQEALADELEQQKQSIEDAEDLYSRREDVLANYEDSLDTLQDVQDQMEEILRDIEDAKLEKIDYELEITVTVKNMKDVASDLAKSIAEAQGDYLTHWDTVAAIDEDTLRRNIGLIEQYQTTYAEYLDLLNNATEYTDVDAILSDIEDLQGDVADLAEELLEWAESLEEMLPDAIDAAAERFAQFTDQLEHNETVLETIAELYELQGVTYKTADGYAKLQQVSQEKLESQLAQAALYKEWYENARTQLLEAEAALEGVSEDDAMYDTLKANRDALLEEYNSAQEAMLESAQNAMETAQEMYTTALEETMYEFEQILTDGTGFDLLQEKYDNYIETESRYLDTVNEAYEVASWYSKLQADIDNTTSSSMKAKLTALQEEIDTRREGNTLSEYDLEILEAKYNVLQAEMALEDAQNAKNSLRLVRDSQGNWNYQYTADTDQIASAQQDLLDAENEWYNIAKQQVEDVTGEIISTWQECQEEIEDIYSDMTLTDEERAERAQEIYEYYTEKIKYLEEEKQIAIADMTEAGNESLVDMALLYGDTVSDLTGLTSEEIKNIVDESGSNIIDLVTADNETLAELVGSNTELIDLFDNVYATDLDNMTSNTVDFEDVLQDTLDQAQDNWEDLQDTIEEVADESGTNLEDLEDIIDDVSYATDECREAGEDAADEMWDQLDAVRELTEGYEDLVEQVWEYIYALQELADDQAETVERETSSGAASSTGYSSEVDYDALIQQGIVQGLISYGDSTYKELMEQRAAKIAAGEGNDRYGSTSAANKFFASLKEGSTESLSQYAQGQYSSANEWYKVYNSIASLDTGGYTGVFGDSKLAFLHEKELVLNKDDTENILAAVNMMSMLEPTVISAIEKALDGDATAAAALMASRIGDGVTITPTNDTIEQYVSIQADFHDATTSDEIQSALAGLVNDASQWAQRRKS